MGQRTGTSTRRRRACRRRACSRTPPNCVSWTHDTIEYIIDNCVVTKSNASSITVRRHFLKFPFSMASRLFLQVLLLTTDVTDAINRHKLTVLTPSIHFNDYSPEDNRFVCSYPHWFFPNANVVKLGPATFLVSVVLAELGIQKD